MTTYLVEYRNDNAKWIGVAKFGRKEAANAIEQLLLTADRESTARMAIVDGFSTRYLEVIG